MSDAGTALLVIALCIVVGIVVAILFRLLGTYRLTSCFATGEEKEVLTQHDQFNGYMVSIE
jgi:hypothetical protein